MYAVKLFICVKLLLTVTIVTSAYKPVFILHGVISGSVNMVHLAQQISKEHPGTVVYNCDKFDGWASLENGWWQAQKIGEEILQIGKLHPEGFHFIGYSQGGIIGRAVLQAFPQHNVKNFISLSSPQAGQFGANFLHLIFPNLAAKTAYELFYSRIGQHTSVGNYWNDPFHQDLYLKYSVFLPYMNNELNSKNSTQFKEAITKLDKLVLIGGPDDGIITPWQSSHFSFFNQSLDVIPFQERDIYKTDAIGLKTLMDKKKLVIITKPNVHHLHWHTDPEVVREIILPHLD